VGFRTDQVISDSLSNAANQALNLLILYSLITENRKLKTENGIKSAGRGQPEGAHAAIGIGG
jgi:hypothetical protein